MYIIFFNLMTMAAILRIIAIGTRTGYEKKEKKTSGRESTDCGFKFIFLSFLGYESRVLSLC